MVARGLNQSSLARKSGVERTVICRIMTGKARPRPEQIGWMAKALGVDSSELLLEADLPQELQDLVTRMRERIGQLERERDEARAEVARLRSHMKTDRPANGADARPG